MGLALLLVVLYDSFFSIESFACVVKASVVFAYVFNVVLGLYDITHPEPIRVLLHPHLNDYDTFLTHYGKARSYVLNLWTVNQKDSRAEKKLTSVELNYQLKHIVHVPKHRCFVAFATDLSLHAYATMNFKETSRTETNHSVLCLYYNACRDEVLAGCLGEILFLRFLFAIRLS